MTDHNKCGRFTVGNGFAYLGWLGLVEKCFQGDTIAAKACLAHLSRHAYAEQALQSTVPADYRLKPIWRHHGTCEQVLSQWRQALSFTIADARQKEF